MMYARKDNVLIWAAIKSTNTSLLNDWLALQVKQVNIYPDKGSTIWHKNIMIMFFFTFINQINLACKHASLAYIF